MIARLTGTLAECAPGQALLDVGGVGYLLQISLRTFYSLSKQVGASVSLHVHTHVREDALQLFGFAEPDERSHFTLLIGISGVGPKMALAILSGIGGGELREAVVRQDKLRFQKIPGVGKKTAERVLLELRDKLAGNEMAVAVAAAGGEREAAGSHYDDAVSALVNLGYSSDAAARSAAVAMKKIGGEPTLEGILKAALGGLVR